MEFSLSLKNHTIDIFSSKKFVEEATSNLKSSYKKL